MGIVWFIAGIALGYLISRPLPGIEKTIMGCVSLLMAVLGGWVALWLIPLFFACAAGCMIAFIIHNVDVSKPDHLHRKH